MTEPTGEQLLRDIGINPNGSKLFYIATPYSHPDPAVRESRFDMACHVSGFLMAQGLHIFSPIAHSHSIACKWDLPKGWDFWGKQDLVVLDRCDVMIVVMATGWDESKGIKEEMIYADSRDIPIEKMPYPDCDAWMKRFLEGLQP